MLTRFASGVRVIQSRDAIGFPVRTRWWLVKTRWLEISWRLRIQDLWYLVKG